MLLAPIKRAGPMTIRTDLVDVHLYVFNRAAVVAELNASPSMASIREELLPALVQKQFCSPELLCQAEAASAGATSPPCPFGCQAAMPPLPGRCPSLSLLLPSRLGVAEKPGEANTDSPVHSRQVLEAPDVDWQRFNHSSGAAGSKWPGW